LPGTAGFSLLLEKCGKLVWQIARRRTQRAAQDNELDASLLALRHDITRTARPASGRLGRPA